AVVGLVLGQVAGVGAGTQLGLVLAAVLVAAAFVAANQAAVALLGNLGRGLALAAGAVVVATAVVATVPEGLRAALDVLPVGPAQDLLAGVLNATGGLGWPVVALIAWAGLSFAAAALGLARPRRSLARRVVGLRATAAQPGRSTAASRLVRRAPRPRAPRAPRRAPRARRGAPRHRARPSSRAARTGPRRARRSRSVPDRACRSGRRNGARGSRPRHGPG